jgi:hypothetical protein
MHASLLPPLGPLTSNPCAAFPFARKLLSPTNLAAKPFISAILPAESLQTIESDDFHQNRRSFYA